MVPTDDQLRRWILMILYPETNTLTEVKPIKITRIAKLLEVDEQRIMENLSYFYTKGWATNNSDGVKLTDDAVWAIRQHERTYCPYI